MNPIPIIPVLVKALFVVLGIGLISPSYAATPIPLNTSSREYDHNGGRPYYLIDEEGSYYLDFFGEETFHTTNYFAIRIWTHNVFLDGRGKTITGLGPPSDPKGSNDIVGVWVNVGPQAQNVQIKNLNVEKKFYGILFEWIYNGRVENCNTSGNTRGITLWNSEMTTLDGNTANNNSYGIEFDANNCVNQHNTLSNNTVNNNALAGIILHL